MSTVVGRTPTGLPVVTCTACDVEHPRHRRHCAGCGAPSLFIGPAGDCRRCRAGVAS